jgi:hypothetical protein
MRTKQPPDKAKRQVLSDYKRVGAKFVPPMLHRVGAFDYISWANQTLPELVWWDVLMDRVSHRFAARVVEVIGNYFKSKNRHECWWAFTSDYTHVDGNDVDGLKDHMQRAGVLAAFADGIFGFLCLYPECPISRLSDRPPADVDIKYLCHFESRMRELEDKRSRSSVLIQAQAVYMGFVVGKLHVQRGLALADFPEVQHYPDSERSKQVGASICAAVNMLAGSKLPKYSDDTWTQYFWRRSLELRPLDFTHLEEQ